MGAAKREEPLLPLPDRRERSKAEEITTEMPSLVSPLGTGLGSVGRALAVMPVDSSSPHPLPAEA